MRAGMIFFMVSIVIYIIISIFDLNLASKSFLTFLCIFKRIILILLVVFLLIFLTNILLSPEIISSHLGHTAGIKGWIISIVGGILSTGPIYLWYPLLADLKERGMKDSFIATFLYNRAIKLPLLPLMIHYFGIKLVVVLTVYMVIFSVINGIVVEKIVKLLESEQNKS